MSLRSTAIIASITVVIAGFEFARAQGPSQASPSGDSGCAAASIGTCRPERLRHYDRNTGSRAYLEC